MTHDIQKTRLQEYFLLVQRMLPTRVVLRILCICLNTEYKYMSESWGWSY